MPTQDRLEIRIGADAMEVRLLFSPLPMESGGYYLPSLAELEIHLREGGIKAALDKPSVQAALQKAAAGKRQEVVAVRGRAPSPGPDGYLEFLVDCENPLPPSLATGGQVDLKSSSLIRSVEAGQPLALIHDPGAGEPGEDVYGRPVPARLGAPLAPKLGSNTARAPHDPRLIVAATDGHLRLFEGTLEVQECLNLRGDVDYVTGNISFAKAVKITGDVKSGFSVESGGDAEVGGMVEDCAIKSQGKILIKGGFTGQGKGLVQARGSIGLDFVRNQRVKGEGDIVVAREAINSKLQSRRAVYVRGLLAGGRVQARNAIECEVAGTDTGTPTFLEAGCDFSLSEELEDIQAQMERMGRYNRKLDDGLREIQNIEKLNRGLEPWTIDLVFEMERMRGKAEAKIAALGRRFSLLEKQASQPGNAYVTILKKVHPGVVIKIGSLIMHIEEPMAGPKTFSIHQGAIQAK